ncbi:MAG: radical SAM protein [candidate division Zixibacteria bacterium]|nr:radical SAM protein [candidate division Zixibacteria bacterium]
MLLPEDLKIHWHRFKNQVLKPSVLPKLLNSGVRYSLMSVFGRDYHPTYPLVLMVEPSARCNLKCPLCATGAGEVKRTPSDLDFELYKNVIDKFSSHLLYVLLFNQGEPFLNRCFVDMIRYSHDKNVYTITSSNGHYIRNVVEARNIIRSGLDEIIMSLDGLTEDVYSRYRVGGDFNRVIEGIKLLVKEKKELSSFTPIIELQILLTADTEGQIDKAREFGENLGVDIVSAKTLQLLDMKTGREFLPDNEKYRRYQENSGDLKLRGGYRNRCGRLYYSMSINSDGTVVPCCFDKSGKYVFGNIADENVGDIWNGHKFRAFRKRILENRSAIDICSNCTEGIDYLYSKKWYV